MLGLFKNYEEFLGIPTRDRAGTELNSIFRFVFRSVFVGFGGPGVGFGCTHLENRTYARTGAWETHLGVWSGSTADSDT